MPITQSAKKALRQSRRRYETNMARKDAIKANIRTIKKLVAEKKIEDAKKALSALFKAADKAAKIRAIEKNRAARIKSRIARLVNSKIS